MSDESRSVFARYVEEPEKEQPPVTIPRGPLLQPIIPPSDNNSPPVEKLLDFIVNRWRKPVIRVRDLCRLGPRAIRNRKTAMDMAEVLAANGWLTPIEGRQYNEKMWRVVRGGQTSQMSPDK